MPAAQAPPLSPDQRKWMMFRDGIGDKLDTYLRGKPPADMRNVVRELEHILAMGDHTAGLLGNE